MKEPLNQESLRSFASRTNLSHRDRTPAARSAQDDTVFFVAEQEGGDSSNFQRGSVERTSEPRRETAVWPSKAPGC